ncbi:hypothetical protein DL765_006859 [Monosporascus sp. GIB2]|nr:hypothetical protein DL765_006859 [Monosporascus sp. GIB2]
MPIDPSNTAVIPVPARKFSNRETWPDWFTQLRYHARFRGIWQYVNPNAQDAPHLPATAPTEGFGESVPTESSGVAAIGQLAATGQPAATLQGDRELCLRERAVLSSRYTSLWNWINATVDAQLFSSYLRKLDLFHLNDDPSI